jgi:cellobiose-specific phosphotransferase system component IIC
MPAYNVFMFLLIPLGLVSLAGVAYLAVSRKTDTKVRFAALGALALMMVAAIICLFVIFSGGSIQKVQPLPDALPSEIPPPSGTNFLALIPLVIIVAALFGLVIIMGLREQRKKAAGIEKSKGNAW